MARIDESLLGHLSSPPTSHVPASLRRVAVRSPVKDNGWDFLWAFDRPGAEPGVLRAEWVKKGFAGETSERRLKEDLKAGMEVRW